MLNDLQRAKDFYNITDREIAERLEARTGFHYSPEYIRQMRNGYKNPNGELSRALQLAIRITFPDLHETEETA